MAKTVREPKVGDLVYRAYNIQTPGKIVAVIGPLLPHKYFTVVDVKWLDGSVERTDNCALNDYNHAIEDHRKKYEKFEKIAVKLRSI